MVLPERARTEALSISNSVPTRRGIPLGHSSASGALTRKHVLYRDLDRPG